MNPPPGPAPEHILLGLLREGGSLAAQILIEAGLDLDQLRRAALPAMNSGDW